MLRPGNGRLVQFWQTVHVVIARGRQTEILRQVDDLHPGRHIVSLQELRALAMPETEKDHVHLVERQLVRKHQIGFPIQSFVHVGDLISGVTGTIDKLYLRFGVVQQDAAKFAGRISCPSYDSNSYHLKYLFFS